MIDFANQLTREGEEVEEKSVQFLAYLKKCFCFPDSLVTNPRMRAHLHRM